MEPYYDHLDDVVSQVAQITIFFSLLASIITDKDPNDPVLSRVLPVLLIVPIVLVFIFSSRIFEVVHCSGGRSARFARAVQRSAIARLDSWSGAATAKERGALRKRYEISVHSALATSAPEVAHDGERTSSASDDAKVGPAKGALVPAPGAKPTPTKLSEAGCTACSSMPSHQTSANGSERGVCHADHVGAVSQSEAASAGSACASDLRQEQLQELTEMLRATVSSLVDERMKEDMGGAMGRSGSSRRNRRRSQSPGRIGNPPHRRRRSQSPEHWAWLTDEDGHQEDVKGVMTRTRGHQKDMNGKGKTTLPAEREGEMYPAEMQLETEATRSERSSPVRGTDTDASVSGEGRRLNQLAIMRASSSRTTPGAACRATVERHYTV